MNETSNDLSVVIVNYRTPEMTIRCIRSILYFGIAEASAIVVVDNMSNDGSADAIASALPQIRLIRSAVNQGFGAGVNLGACATTGNVLLVLNPDTYFLENSVGSALALIQSDRSIQLLF